MKRPIQILDYTEFAETEAALNERRKPASEDGEEAWERYHKALWAVAEEVGQPHQFTPMSGAHQRIEPMTSSAITRVLHPSASCALLVTAHPPRWGA